jgi:ABC-2 type transport system ATP-binding protein
MTAETLYVVETRGLTKRFGETTVVHPVDLRVPRGTAFGYLGPNGAGKTTLIRMLLGLTKPTAGEMSLLGLPVPARRRQALARVGAIVDEPRFHGHMTGRQNLSALAAAREPRSHHRIDGALDRVGLLERADDRVAKYSMGMRQRLGIAACLIADPELLILDEPMNGLDPAGMLELRGLIRSLVDEGRTVVLSSHLLDEVEKTCDAIAIVDRGRVVLQGSIDDLVAGDAATLRIECSNAAQAALILQKRTRVERVRVADGGVVVRLAAGDPRVETSGIARLLLDADIELYSLQMDHGSLEERFLELTSPLGKAA